MLCCAAVLLIGGGYGGKWQAVLLPLLEPPLLHLNTEEKTLLPMSDDVR